MTGITPDLLLYAYSQGIFPMAEGAGVEDIFWVDPEERGIFPLNKFHVPRRLIRTIKQHPFEIRINTDFHAVIQGCAAINGREGRDETWINDEIIELYAALFDQGFVHTVECWQEGELVGGLYGVSLGGAFCGESMFHKVTDASKVALVYLVARLQAGGYQLLDTQFITPHLARFGATTVSKLEYKLMLQKALRRQANFHSLPIGAGPETILQLTTQIS